MAKQVEGAKKTKMVVSIPEKQKELLEYMLGKTELDKNELFEEFVASWINRNTDLLNKGELTKFKDMFFHAKSK